MTRNYKSKTKTHKISNGVRKFILITGGARSGKSRYAVELAKRLSAGNGSAFGRKKKVAFIATATSLDKEMEKRIKFHRISRPRHWKLIEEGEDVSSILSKLKGKYELVLIDCLGLLICNLLLSSLKDEEIEKYIRRLLNAISKVNLSTILVSNEVGSGIVSENPLARRFRDLVGLSNQMIAKKADEVILMQSGIPIILKGDK